jgi:hypothetical protein
MAERFGTGDVHGPPSLSQARERIEDSHAPRTRHIDFDGMIVYVVVAALIAIAALGALYLVGLPG